MTLPGTMRAMFLVWKWTHGAACPFRTYHALGEDYVPLDARELPPLRAGDEPWTPRPVLPRSWRYVKRNILLAFAGAAEEEHVEMLAARAGVVG